jgi:hypothetical protein
MSGKGSGRRPTLVSDKEAEDNWARIFGKCEALPQGDKPAKLSGFPSVSNGSKCPDVVQFYDDKFDLQLKAAISQQENEMFGKKPKDTGKKPTPGKKGNKC